MTTSVNLHSAQQVNHTEATQDANAPRLSASDSHPPISDVTRPSMDKVDTERLLSVLRQGFLRGDVMAITPDNLRADMGKTYNLNDKQRANYAVKADAGRLQSNGAAMSTAKNVAHDKAGFAAFVLSTDGKLYAFNHLNKTDHIAHSSFAGKFAVGAGEFKVEDGKVTVVTSHSGHFKPNLLNMGTTLQKFSEQGILAEGAKISFVADPFKGLGYKDAPKPSAPLQTPTVLDEDSKAAMQSAKQNIATKQQEKAELETLLKSPNEISARYEEAVANAHKQLESRKAECSAVTSDPSMLKMLCADEQRAVDNLENGGLKGFQAKLERGVKDCDEEIAVQKELIHDVQRPMTLEHVYDAKEIMDFVSKHKDELSKQLTPAFLS